MVQAERLRNSISPIIATNGLFLLIIGATEFVLGFLDLMMNWGNAQAFFLSGIIVLMMGSIAWLTNHDADSAYLMTRRQVLLGMLSAWFVSSAAGALPFYFGAPQFGLLKSYFEAVSAFTTTGATVMTGIENQPPSVLLWRSIMHWYGGMGIIIGAMVLFPAMRIGGMQFFLRVGFETTDKILPSARALGLATLYIYSLLTFLCFASYVLVGMPAFDAFNMSMSTMATGGMAVSDGSFAPYSGNAEYVGSFFMLVAGCPLILFIMAARGNWKALFYDTQVRAFLFVYATIVLAILLYRIAHHQGGLEHLLRDTMFNSASLLTGTGFSNGDFQLWGSFPTMVLMMAMFIGGCTGSTAGSIKIFRYQVLIAMIRVRIQRLYYPDGIFHAKYAGRPLDDRVMESVAAFFMIYLINLAVLTVLFGFGGLDLITAFSAAVSAVGNVGPGLGPEIGPVGNYANFEAFPMGVFTLAMVIGRLEFMFFYALMLPRFWQH